MSTLPTNGETEIPIKHLPRKGCRISGRLSLAGQSTKTRVARHALLKARKDNHAAHRLACEFLATINLENRTPMIGLIGMTQLLQNPDLTAEERSDYARMLARHSQNLFEQLDHRPGRCQVDAGEADADRETLPPRQVLSAMLLSNAERARRKGDALSIECRLTEERTQCSGDRWPSTYERRDTTPEHILVAEDTPSHARVLEIMLGKLGYRVSLVSNGQQAVDWIMHRPLPDLILMDYHMPVMDGLEATRRIRSWEKESARSQAVPIVALTSSAFENDRKQCLAAGMNEFLSKPFHLIDLKVLLEKLLYDAKSSRKPNITRANPEERPINLLAALGRMGGDLETFLHFAAAVPVQMARDHAEINEIALAAGSVGWSEPTPATTLAEAKVLRRACHRLRGVFSTLGAERAHAACQALEVAAMQHDSAAYPARIQELEAAMAALKPALDDLLAYPAEHFSGH